MAAVPNGNEMATCVYSAQGNMMCGAANGMTGMAGASMGMADPIINTNYRSKSNTCGRHNLGVPVEENYQNKNEQSSFMGSLGKLVDASSARLRKESYSGMSQQPQSKPGPSAFDVANDFTGTWAPWTPL
jgi:hypothetical protein